MKIVFNISNCAVENQVKFATCTLHDVAFKWWKSHVKTVGHDAAYGGCNWNFTTELEIKDMPLLLNVMANKKGSLRTLQGTIRTNNNKTRGRTLVKPTLLGIVRKRSMVDLCQNVLSATTTIMVHVHRCATSATRLATGPLYCRSVSGQLQQAGNNQRTTRANQRGKLI
ncbi:hypothetical protein Tco_0038189 [Tanacetum coccineum]